MVKSLHHDALSISSLPVFKKLDTFISIVRGMASVTNTALRIPAIHLQSSPVAYIEASAISTMAASDSLAFVVNVAATGTEGT